MGSGCLEALPRSTEVFAAAAPPNDAGHPQDEATEKVNEREGEVEAVPGGIKSPEEEGAKVRGEEIEDGPTEIPHPAVAPEQAGGKYRAGEGEAEEVGSHVGGGLGDWNGMAGSARQTEITGGILNAEF